MEGEKVFTILSSHSSREKSAVKIIFSARALLADREELSPQA